VIDLHAHLLAGIDDGPATLDESVAMARAAVDAGITEVVATPHVSSRYPNDAQVIGEALADVRAAIERAGLPLRVHGGAEIALDRALALSPEALDALRLGTGPYLLLESPLGSAASDVELVMRALHARGHRILLAHPERSPRFQRDVRELERLVAQGALTSVTSSAFSGRFGRTVQRFAMHLLHAGLVHSIASDMHDLVGRPPGIASPVRAADDGEERHAARFAWLSSSVPAAILAGTTIPPGPAPPPGPRTSAERVRLVRRRLARLGSA
jgi:protein-tyrosine phosphatase